MNTDLVSQISSDLDHFCTTWKTNDGAALGAHFTEDGSLVNPFGERADGRGAISSMYSDYFSGMLHGTSTTFTLANARIIGTDHAFTDGEQLIRGSDGAVVLTVHLAALLRREGGVWRFLDARPYTPARPPA